ncbi:lipoprotein [Mycoplasmopsis bovirhinis]|uniref:Ig-specific serine endopeptidase MIP n=1 Tax=Mycoplasmopsis bovirhinis TaxID=29553 RepID=UPI000BB9CDAB|nr:DUF31 family protein [Mycoplasmopsis bovirhinis]BBA22270.1 lipoprotein [Mycoplasmopsis bovirhinis]
MKKKLNLILGAISTSLPFALIGCTNSQESKPDNGQNSTNNAVENFKTTHAEILAKNQNNITEEDEAKVTAALSAYSLLNEQTKNALTSQKTLLEQLAAKIFNLKQIITPSQDQKDSQTPPKSGNAQGSNDQSQNDQTNPANGETTTNRSASAQLRLDFFVNWNNEQRYDYENNREVEKLKTSHENGLNNSSQYPQNYRSVWQLQKDLDTTQTNKTKFDNLAKSMKLDTFDNNRFKSFTVPSYKEDGTIDGLNIQKKLVIHESDIEYLIAGENQTHGLGLGRTLTNEKYKDIALETFAITVDNQGATSANDPLAGRQYSGTAWILDYELSEDGKYPTKWYLASNLHVIQYLGSDTKNLWLGRVDEDTPLNQTISTKDRLESEKNYPGVFNEWFTKFKLNLTDPALKDKVKLVYTAVDFLKKDPKDYLSQSQQTEFGEYKEYSDFAVFEIDLTGVSGNSGFEVYSQKPNSNSVANAEEFLKRLTNNYATKQEKQSSLLKESYLKNYDPINIPIANNNANTNKDYLLSLGYPANFGPHIKIPNNISGDRETIIRWVEQYYNIDFGNQMNLWTNEISKNPKWLQINPQTSEATSVEIPSIVGNRLTSHVSTHTFKDKPGVFDAFLSWPLVNNTERPLTVNYNGKLTPLIQMGLGYALANYEGPGGASGSSVRNQKNQLVGIFHSVANFTLLGMAAAFRSEGFDYQGLYGSYNLPQYDLIYGGGKDQASSYREALAKVRPNIKTRLFKNGASATYEEFKFNE